MNRRIFANGPALEIVSPVRESRLLFLGLAVLQTDETRPVKTHWTLRCHFIKISLSVCVYFDQFQILLTFFEVICYFDILIMFIFLLKMIKHFVDGRISHFVLPLLCFFKHILIFSFQLLILQPPTIEVYLLLITHMSIVLFLIVFFDDRRSSEGMGINAIVVFTLMIDLNKIKCTLFILQISSWSMREALRFAWAVLRSLLSLILPWL